MSLLINGKPEIPRGISAICKLDPGGLQLTSEDYRPRSAGEWVRSIILHTTVGDEPQIVRPGYGPSGMAARTAAAWATDNRHAGSHIIIDGDARVFCLADLQFDAAYDATTINEVSIGIELAQSRTLEIWQEQIDQLIRLLDWLTARFGIQRQYQRPYLGDSHPVARLAAGGRDAVGIFGHRDQTDQRGRGDPGDAVIAAVAAAGYEGFDFDENEDLMAWMPRQSALSVHADGEPGPLTVAALLAAGHSRGLWVARPGD